MSDIRFEHVSKRFTLRRSRPRSFQELFLTLLHPRRSGPPALQWPGRLDKHAGRGKREQYWALRDVSFEVERGEVVALIGPNGAGKSTVLKLASRVIEATTGQISVNGRVGALLELGTGFHPDLSGRENIYLNGSILGFSRAKIQRILPEIVEFSELERFIDVPVKQYSSGMYMRLAFSVAVHIEPEILLIDEVLSVGDQAFQSRCLDKINELKRAGITVVLVSHALDTVRGFCARAIWLDKGTIRADGQVDQVLEQYIADVQRVDKRSLHEAEMARHTGSAQAAIRQTNAPWRWGSREAELMSVELLNRDGEETRSFETGETFVARLRYVAHQRIEKPMFGVALHHVGGFHINGPNTRFANYPIDFIDGEGCIDYVIDELPLLPGSYLFSAALYDTAGAVAYDHHHMAYTFRVSANEKIKERYGSFYIRSRWQLTPGERKNE